MPTAMRIITGIIGIIGIGRQKERYTLPTVFSRARG